MSFIGTPLSQGQAPRPGPFGPAGELINKNLPLVTVRVDEDLYRAVSRLNDDDYSQAPVLDQRGHVVGMYSERGLSDFLDERGESANIQLSQYKVDAVMDPNPILVHPDQFIDTSVDWMVTHAVIVGTREEPIGVLTIWDVWAHLNDFAEAFVLIYELESCLRNLITEIMGVDLATELAQWKYRDDRPTPQALEEFTFSQYSDFLGRKQIWARLIERQFRNKGFVLEQLLTAAKLRNQIVHFRKMTTAAETDSLRKILNRFKSMLRELETYQEDP